MFERFTDRARKVVVLAQSAAGDSPMLPMHLFLGLVQEGGSLAYRVLSDAGVTRDVVSRRATKDGGPHSGSEVRLGAEVLEVFDHARAAMERLGHTFVAPEHLLLALLYEPGDLLAEIMEEGHSSRDELVAELHASLTVDPTTGDPRNLSLGRLCEKCGASIEEYGKVKDLTLGIEDKPEAISVHAYFCGECGSAYGLVKE